MTRKSTKTYREVIFFHRSDDKKTEIFVDKINSEEIYKYVSMDAKHIKKFKYISSIILNRLHNTDVYDKEDINDNCKNVTAMKFFKGGDNDRIYCKVYSTKDKIKVVIMCSLYLKKKSQKNSKREIQELNKIGNYEYKF